VLKAIELKKEGLNRTNNDIKKQVSLMEFSKSNNFIVEDDDGDYDGLVTGRSTKIPLDDDDVELYSLFGDGGASNEPELPPTQDAPEEIPESAAVHYETNPEDPITDTSMGDDEDPNEFLVGITLDDVGADSAEDSADEVEVESEPEPVVLADDTEVEADAGESLDDDELAGLFDDFEPLDLSGGEDDSSEDDDASDIGDIDDDDNVIDMESFINEL
jgi:hypothetical protein